MNACVSGAHRGQKRALDSRNWSYRGDGISKNLMSHHSSPLQIPSWTKEDKDIRSLTVLQGISRRVVVFKQPTHGHGRLLLILNLINLVTRSLKVILSGAVVHVYIKPRGLNLCTQYAACLTQSRTRDAMEHPQARRGCPFP